MGKIFENILKINFYASLLPLGTLIVLTMLDVGARNIFNSSINSALEICSLCLSVMISLALGMATYKKEQFSVDFVTVMLPKRIRFVLEALTCLVGSVVCYVLAIQTSISALYSLKIGEYAGSLEVPVYPAKFIFAYGFMLVGITLTVQSISSFRRKKSSTNGKS